MRERIKQGRKLIDKVVDAVASRMGTYDFDHEEINDDAEVNVEYRVEYEPYLRVTLVDLYIYSSKEREYKNIERVIRERLEQAAEKLNGIMETDYIEGLTTKKRRDYYAWTA